MQKFAGLSVLLVEDEYLIALDAEQILKGMGVESVRIAASFTIAEKLASEEQFDVAVLDVNLNGRHSFPIATIIEQRGIPFIFASGYELRDRALSGLHDAICVSKPYTSDRLKDALSAALAKGSSKA